jgi:tetratricopeptide (TPR) repeat protein
MADTPRLTPLFRTRSFLLAALTYGLVGGALMFLPLTNYLGLEFSLVLGIVAGLIGGPLAVTFYLRLLNDPDHEARLAKAVRVGPQTLWLQIVLAHAIAASFGLIGPLIRWALLPPCAPGRGLGYLFLLPLASIVYASAWGMAAGSLVARPRRAKTLVVLLALGTLVLTVVGFLTKPTVWVYNPFFGHFPGPIYDAGTSPSLALIAYRIGNLAEAWMVVLIAGLFWRRLAPRAQPSERPFISVALLVLATAVSFGIHTNRFALGFDMDQDELKKRLTGHVATEHFDIYFPERDYIVEQMNHVARDHEFRFAQIERELGFEYPHRITSFIYPSEKAKKDWIGAGGTEYADCANHEMHLNWDGFPLNILHHEMIHIMLSDFGMPVVGFSNSIAITEGIAVAFGGPPRWDQELDRWAAGMKAIGRLPRIKNIMGLRFWEESGARAYTTAGSFIAYLVSLPDGRQKVLASYARGNLEENFGRPVAELERDWLAHLTAIEATLSDAEIERARYRFGFKSIFERRCPREVGRLLSEAERYGDRSYFHKADLLIRHAAELDRDNPRLERLRVPALLRLGRIDEARRLAEEIVASQGTPDNPALDRNGRVVGSRLIAQGAEMTLAEIDWVAGNIDAARRVFARIAADRLRSGSARHAACSLYALDHPEVEPALRAYLTDLPATRTGSWDLLAASRTHPADPVVQYLLARRALRDDAYTNAIELLDRALATGLPHPDLTEEALRARGLALFLSGDLPSAAESFSAMRRHLVEQGKDTITADTWLARVDAWPALASSVGEVTSTLPSSL